MAVENGSGERKDIAEGKVLWGKERERERAFVSARSYAVCSATAANGDTVRV